MRGTRRRRANAQAKTINCPRTKKPIKLPADLETELAKVRAAAPPPRADDPVYKYLQRIYLLRCKLAGAPDLQKALKAYHADHCPRTLQKYAGVIIEMTAGGYLTHHEAQVRDDKRSQVCVLSELRKAPSVSGNGLILTMITPLKTAPVIDRPVPRTFSPYRPASPNIR